MATLVDATVPTKNFALHDTLEQIPEAKFQTVRVATHEPGRVMPFLWASAPDFDELHDSLVADPTTESVQSLSRKAERMLFEIAWQHDISSIIRSLVKEKGTLLRSTAQHRQWTFRVLFPVRDAVSTSIDFCREQGFDLSIRRVKGISNSFDQNGAGLSRKQYEAIAAAYEKGYYDVPRGMTLAKLADEVGVSHQALSERLRRGHYSLISNMLSEAPETIEIDP